MFWRKMKINRLASTFRGCVFYRPDRANGVNAGSADAIENFTSVRVSFEMAIDRGSGMILRP
ncbi:hypothetical protein RMSM_03667 [Rhodopirellula maiorica SM1]|uniref:Uncharacterized protein n=1 Tax=Rhodopirellula maiorica SM1 TaxID=1265738 RepID=M5RJD6_9BACT|nr:hypothetical protein RMSM_03667 [Rhodopirellula maiorica SM1]